MATKQEIMGNTDIGLTREQVAHLLDRIQTDVTVIKRALDDWTVNDFSMKPNTK